MIDCSTRSHNFVYFLVPFVICAIIVLCMRPAVSHAQTLGVFGNTYQIAEKDALDEIMERAKQANWKQFFNKKTMTYLKNRHEAQTEAHLPKARAPKTFAVDMTYTLSFDIYDINGNILYPKGYTFNPLQFVALPYSLVVIDGSDKAQVAWFRASEYSIKLDSMVMITGGETRKLIKNLRRPVYVCDQRIVDRFKLQAVPSIIRQNGIYMEVQEIVVPDKK